MNFFKKEDPKETARANDRQIRRTGRDLSHDYKQLERREKELEAEIKKLAKTNQIAACKTLAKQLVQIRDQKAKNIAMNAKITSVGHQAKTMGSMNTMAGAMSTTAQTMKIVDKQMPLEKFAAQMRDFQQTNDRMDMRSEVISDTLDSMLDVDEGEEEAVIDQVLDEIGIEVRGKVSEIYTQKNNTNKKQII
jgi:charged multivesicular body protein 2B